jgi:hypothetical protein
MHSTRAPVQERTSWAGGDTRGVRAIHQRPLTNRPSAARPPVRPQYSFVDPDNGKDDMTSGAGMAAWVALGPLLPLPPIPPANL